MIELEREVREKLLASGVAASVSWASETGSTNDDAKRAASNGASAPALFVADSQTHGRGRAGNAWLSAKGEGLLFSLVLRPRLRPDATAPVTLAVGAVIAKLLDDLAPGRCRVKWPNDVELDEKKVAGILVEAQTRGDRIEALIVGVGINVTGKALPSELAATATSLALAGVASADRVVLLADAVVGLVEAIDRFGREGLAPFLEDIRGRDALFGQRVAVDGVSGTAAGIDDGGKLLIRDDAGVLHACASGHVERAHR